MVSWLTRLLTAGALALFGAAPAQAEWLEASNSHFIVYGDMKREEMQRFADRLERFDAALHAGLNLPEVAPATSNRVVIYVVRNQGAIVDLGRDSAIAGFYRADISGPIAVTPRKLSGSDKDFNPEVVLFHEYVHHIMLSNSESYYPAWVVEGMAEFFSFTQVEPNGDVTIGMPNNARATSIFSDEIVSLSDLLNADAQNGRRVYYDQLYARGWLLIHYLLLGGKRQGQFAHYLALLNDGTPPLKAATDAFGSLTTLDRELNYYREKSMRAVAIAAAKLQMAPITIRALDAGEAAMMPFRVPSAVGVDDKRAKALVAPARAAAAAYPDHAWVQQTLAEIEYDAGNDAEARAAADRALAVDPKNVMALIHKGLIEMRRAKASKPNDPALWKLARSWFVKANRADPDYAYPYELFYRTFAGAGETPGASAIAGLARAVELAPQNDELRMMLAMEKLRAGDLAAVRTVLAPVAADPHGGGENPAAKLIALIDSGAGLAAVQAEADKLAPKPKSES